jgi:NAD(P)H-dependent flavin oxidoreductase YrpB (nitropropane dioxygenase family)
VNLVLEWPQFARLGACLDEGVAVVSTSWGDPEPYTTAVHQAGALHVHMVGSVEEARRAVAAGVDAVVAQGWEAGGHVSGEVTTLALVPAVVEAVAPVPVLAAGGICDGRGLAAVLALGAVAGWLGSRFLFAAEADVHDDYRARLMAATEVDTVHSYLFDIGWPGAPHRTLRNSTVRAWEAAGRPAPSGRPGEGDVVALAEGGRTVLRYSDDLPTGGITGDTEAMALYAGQGVSLVHSVEPAGVIARDLVADAQHRLSSLGASGRPPPSANATGTTPT